MKFINKIFLILNIIFNKNENLNEINNIIIGKEVLIPSKY